MKDRLYFFINILKRIIAFIICQLFMLLLQQITMHDQIQSQFKKILMRIKEKPFKSSLSKFKGKTTKIKHIQQQKNEQQSKMLEMHNQKVEHQLMLHPARKFILFSVPSMMEFKKFATYLYRGLAYSIFVLHSPSDSFIIKKSVTLPQRSCSKRKFLMLDLDQTLIHSVSSPEKSDVTLSQNNLTIRFNIRPYCLQFLQKISQHYDVYVFTAAVQQYAQLIVNFLNLKQKTIQGIISRKRCFETKEKLIIKDLRIIRNRPLSQIVIVDNMVHSFGLQIDNGIPILQFKDNKQDRQLVGLANLLVKLKDVSDVREWISKNIALRKCLEIPEKEFLLMKPSSLRLKQKIQ